MSNLLIYAISTKGKLSYEQFNNLFSHVYMSSDSDSIEQININQKQKTIRILESLGYCEFDFKKRKVYVCKPSLVLLPSFGLPKALLTGARTPQLVNKVRESIRECREKALIENKNHSSENNVIPNSIYIRASKKRVLESIAEQSGIFCDLSSPAAWKLANLSTEISYILDVLQFEERTGLNWDKRIFDIERLMFSRFPVREERIQLIEYRHPVNKQLYHWLWIDGKAAEVARDWGRYAILSKTDHNVLIYNKFTFNLAVPVSVPLPCLLARSAALCSGKPPYYALIDNGNCQNPSDGHYQVYSDVFPKIAHMIANKLNQKLITKNFIREGKKIIYV